MNLSQHALATRCAHAGASRNDGTSNPPFHQAIAQSSVFRLGTATEAEEIFSGNTPGFAYTRFGNPTVAALADAIADLEGGNGAMVAGSGNGATLCAITAAMAGRTGPLVTHPDIYGGSFELLHLLSNVYGLSVLTVDPNDQPKWIAALETAGAVLIETPSNPLMRLIDIEETTRHARVFGAPVIVDNTVATPFNQRPFEYGAEWIIHSTSKYLNGHSDMIGGCVVKRQALTSQDRAVHKNLGGTVNAMEAWLILRGLRTFALRMKQHNLNGEAVIEWLRKHPEVNAVHYPGTANSTQAAIREKQMTHGGSLLSFELKGGTDSAVQFLDRLQLIVHAVSLGGMESLTTRPAMSSHRGMTPEARKAAGIDESLIRLSVGTEDLDDILADLDQALAPV